MISAYYDAQCRLKNMIKMNVWNANNTNSIVFKYVRSAPGGGQLY